MQNSLYLTDADSVSFDTWFSEGYRLVHPDKPILGQLCKSITIVVTEDCNFDCTYCYLHHKKQISMSEKTAGDVVDFILNTEALNDYIDPETSPGVILDFIGGEPLLEIDLIDKFMDYFIYRSVQLNHPWKDNYVISMSSNGSLYATEKVQDFIRKYHGRVHIGITIDGTKELHDACRVYKDGRGTYDDVLKGVKLRFANKEHPSTKVTMAPENLRYLCEATIHLFSLGYLFLHCNVVFEDVWKTEHAKLLYSELKELADIILDRELYKNHNTSMFSESIGMPIPPEENDNWCGGTGNMMAIGTDGICYPCLRYMEYSFANKESKPMIIGNIYDGIADAGESKVRQCLKCITRRTQSTDECFNCPVARGCAWCSAYNYDCFGTPDKRTTFHCSMHKARVLANVYFWNSLYHKLDLEKRFAFHMPDQWALEIIDGEELDLLKNLNK
jgi:uncharacterized protein